MRTAIIYASKHGTTEKVARKLQDGFGEEQAQLFNLKKNNNFDVTQFDQIIVGGSIHAGQIQKSVKRFLDKHTQDLLQRRLGLFLCCMHENEAENQFNTAFPEILRSHAKSKKIMGGEFLFEKMNFVEKALVKKIAGVKESVSKVDDNNITSMVDEMRKEHV
jgi:menaquinone-dependent protoporphyrinogen oxidase